MTDPVPSGGGATRARQRWWMITGVAAFAVVVAVAAFLVGRSTDDEDASSSTTTTAGATTSTTAAPGTTSSSTTTTGPGSSTTATTVGGVDTTTAVWPVAGSGVAYHDPVAAAVGFAVDLVGFRDPIAGEYMAGDSRSGEVEIRPTKDGPVTIVYVRQLSGSDDWWVLGATTEAIQVTLPRALDRISSPVALEGTGTAFEAMVSVSLYEDGSSVPLGTGSVMGGSMGQVAPFAGELSFEAPTATAGAIVFRTDSMADGSAWSASVLRIRFTDAGWP